MSWLKPLFQGKQSKEEPSPEEKQTNTAELRRLLFQHLSLDELQDLCRILKVDYDTLPDEGKEAKARELIAYLQRRDRLPDLLKACKQLRPDIAWDAQDTSDQTSASDTPAIPEDVPHEENGHELRVESSSIYFGFAPDYNFDQLRKFMREAFTLEELLKFVNGSEDFKELGFGLPINANHNSATRELFDYAHRRNKVVTLLEQLEKAKPKLYKKHGPFVDSGKLSVNVTFVLKGDVALLKPLEGQPLRKEFEQRILQACEQAFFQTITNNK